MKKSFLITLVLIMGAFATAEEKLHLWTTTSTYQSMIKKHRTHFEKEKGIRLIIPNEEDLAQQKNTRSSEHYYKDLEAGKLEALIVSTSFDDWVKDMKQKGHTIPSDVTYKILGRDLMKIFINPKNPITNLSLENLFDIFTGTKTNWKDFGGPDMEIQVFHTKNKPNATNSFKKIVLKGKDFGGKSVEVEDYPKFFQSINQNPGAIGFVSGGVNSDLVKVIETPPIGRPTTVILKGRMTKNLKAFIDYFVAVNK